MTKLLAGVFSGFAMLFGGLFGHHGAPNPDMGSTTPNHVMASSTSWGHDENGMGSTTPGRMGMNMGSGIMGEVVSVNGTTLTVTGKNGMDSATTTYTVDASSATILKGGAGMKPATTTISAVATGDKVMVQGTVSGTSITAKIIIDGIAGFGGRMMGGMMEGGHMGQKPPVAPTSAQ